MTSRRASPVLSRVMLLGCLPLMLAATAAAHGETSDGDGGLRSLLGGFEVVVASNFFHTLGAMMLLGGLILLLYVLKNEDEVLVAEMDGGDDEEGNSVMKSASMLIWVGLTINIIAGLARLFEPSHPSLGQMFADRWVSIMLFKHFFIIVTVVTGVLATSSKQPLMRRRMLTRISIAFVVIIGILGAAASTIAGA